MPVVYTHTFQIKVDSQDIEGEIEFNEDGITTYKTDDPIEGLNLEQTARINQLFTTLTDIFKAFGGLEKVKIEKK